jgi:hypothetical protein
MESTAQIVILSIAMIIVITIVIVVFYWRWKLFGPRNLSLYGTLTTPPIVSPCTVPNKTVQETRCTDTGVQSEVSYCQPNLDTGYYCWTGEGQSINSTVKIIPCVPTCNTFLWNDPIQTPCLLNLSPAGQFPASYVDPADDWCTPVGSLGTQFNTWVCDAHDGSGPNACVFTCGEGVENADCTVSPNTFPSNGIQLTYSPTNAINEGNVPPPAQLINNSGNWTYTPISSAKASEFPTIPSNQMITSQPCTNFNSYTCGIWVNPNPVQDANITPNCLTYNNSTTQLTPIISPNNASMLYEPGFILSNMVCEGPGLNPRCLPNSGNCIQPTGVINPNGVINPTYKNYIPPNLPDICATATYDSNGHIINITKPQQDLNQCIYADPNLSLTWSGTSNFDYYDATDPYNKFKGIISLPLFVSNSNGYLSLYNTPCPNFTANNINGYIIYNFPGGSGGFIDNKVANPPPSGIPFRFDCKGSITVGLQSTPCALVPNPTNPSGYWGLDPNCNNPSGISNPIVEQTALILFIKPLSISGNQLRCNILTLLQNNYSGWLTYTNSNSLPGYTWGNGSVFPNSTILVWNQGRFDPFNTNTIPGTTVSNLGSAAQFIIVQTGTSANPIYTLLTGTGNPVNTIGINNTGSNSNVMSNLVFTAATFQSQSLASSTSPSTVVINPDLLANSLFYRSNRGSYPTPMCNLLITPD